MKNRFGKPKMSEENPVIERMRKRSQEGQRTDDQKEEAKINNNRATNDLRTLQPESNSKWYFTSQSFRIEGKLAKSRKCIWNRSNSHL